MRERLPPLLLAALGAVWLGCVDEEASTEPSAAPQTPFDSPFPDRVLAPVSPTLFPDALPFLVGANLPWLHYGHDFGTTAWGHDGVSDPRSTERLSGDLTYLAAHGVRVVRWFVFADGRAAPTIEEGGRVAGLDPSFTADFDAMLALIEAHDLVVIPVLFDYLWFADAELDSGVQLGGRSATIADDARRASLLENALEPLFQAYGREPRILAWDLINEPEWAMRDAGGFLAGEAITGAQMRAFVAEVAAAAREHAEQPLTVGSGSVDWMLRFWADAGLDLLQFHYYDDEALSLHAEDLAVAAPVLIGEVPTASSLLSVSDTLDRAYDGGFAGTLFWSLNAEDGASDFERWAEEIGDWSPNGEGPDS